jgi:hypothetical protein
MTVAARSKVEIASYITPPERKTLLAVKKAPKIARTAITTNNTSVKVLTLFLLFVVSVLWVS